MVLLGSISTTIHEDDDVGNCSGHKPTERKRINIGYMHKGYTICRDMFTFLHGISKHRVQNIKTNFSENGLIPRTYGNSLRQSHNALSFRTILNVLNFLQNYAEQHGILLPGRIPGFKRDDVKVLPSSDSKKVHCD